MSRMVSSIAAACVGLWACAASAGPDWRAAVEADWRLQEQARVDAQGPVTPEQDAAGAVDGVKTGEWGMHTNVEKRPWWRVDLEAVQALDRVVVWNRCDGCAHRARHLEVLLSQDGKRWRKAYTHDGTPFGGVPDKNPLTVALEGAEARFVRVQLSSKDYMHWDEVEVFGAAAPQTNIALHRPATQSSVSQWSARHDASGVVDYVGKAAEALDRCRGLLALLGEPDGAADAALAALEQAQAGLDSDAPLDVVLEHYYAVRWLQRRLTFAQPELDFETIFFAKRVPGSFNHMSDQYMGWWSRPGGGLYLLHGFKGDAPELECISGAFAEPGSFLRPTLSYDAKRVLFAWCKHYPELAGEQNKLDKANVPEDALYNIYEMNLDGTGVRQLTRGKYDDFDARYLPDGRIVFLSTRRGQFVQCTPETAALSVAREDLPDVYVRCGGGPERPCKVYTLHTMDANGGNLVPISPFEMFEWTPSVAHDGTIMYSRWDYVDRHNMPYMSLWSIRPDGTNARAVYGNYTHAPHCTFEPQCIPNSAKVVFTASGHHAQTMGSLVLLDTAAGMDGTRPITRMTPEVPFPEIEAWPSSFFANPWPLSERFYLAAWGTVTNVRQGQRMAPNAMGIYLFDAQGNLELLHRDPDISSAWPIAVQPRPTPPVLAPTVDWDRDAEGRFLLADVYRGLKHTPRGAVKALRIVAVPPKTHPTMNYPNLGATRDDPGKCVLGTAPVEPDGSAYFRVPAGVIVFFQALDAQGMAIQTMRGATHVQAGQTLSCIGCHESRSLAPPTARPAAMTRAPSKIAVGPEGAWPLRFDRLVQPVLDAKCVRCHRPGGNKGAVAKLDLTTDKAYDALMAYGKPSLAEHVKQRYAEGLSSEGACAAKTSALWAKIGGGHHGVALTPGEAERLITWMDTYAQRLGSFDAAQERHLLELRAAWRGLLIERPEPDGRLAKR